MAEVDSKYKERMDNALWSISEGLALASQVAWEVRQQYGYQAYVEWLQECWGLKQRMANNLLAVYRLLHERFPDTYGGVWKRFAVSALYVMAAPSTPDEAVQEALELAEGGETVTHAIARGIVQRLTRMSAALDGASEKVVGFVSEHSIDEPELVDDLRRLERSEEKPGSNGTFSEIVSTGGFHYGEEGEKWCDVARASQAERREALKSIAREHTQAGEPDAFSELINAAKSLLEYRQSAGAIGFQLEKADAYLDRMRQAIERLG